MAARENQGYLIAVILLVLLSVILAIATYFGFTNMSEIADQRDSLQQQLDERTQATNAYREQSAILKSYLGLEGYSVSEVPSRIEVLGRTGDKNQTVINETQAITDIYNQDMARYNNKPEGEDGTWKGLIDDFAAAMKNMHNNIIVQRSNIERAEQKRIADLAAKDKEIEAKDQQLAAARQDLQTEISNHDKTRAEMQDSLNNAQQLVDTLKNDVRDAEDRLAGKQSAFDRELAQRQETINALRTQLTQFTRIQTDVADGQIVSVAPTLGRVTINLGYDDNLRRQQTFAIYDQRLNTFEKGKEKAKIEVIRILNGHLAEARIVDQNPLDPILTLDWVLTSVWDPGYAVPIALAGLIDMDGDGESDLQRLISIVERNGGKVVAYNDEEGNVVGQIDENTRYFVRGDEPVDANMGAAYSKLAEQRAGYEVQTISVRELLNSMGFSSEAKIQRLDAEAGHQQFKPRQPPATNDGSAFDEDK